MSAGVPVELDLPAPFGWTGEHVSIALGGGSALFSTRRGGCSSGPYSSLNLGLPGATGEPSDDPGCVRVNRQRFAEAVGLGAPRMLGLRQVHGSLVRRVPAPGRPGARTAPPRWPPGWTSPDRPAAGDGQVTAERELGLVALVADCLPVALFAPGAVAMLHAGWRGLAAGIIAAGAGALAELDPAGPVEAAIGPGIGGCCYEVGGQVRRALGGEVSGGRLDLKRLARLQLEEAGVARVHDVGLCTMCSEAGLFFSHRREHGVTGRQCGVAWRS